MHAEQHTHESHHTYMKITFDDTDSCCNDNIYMIFNYGKVHNDFLYFRTALPYKKPLYCMKMDEIGGVANDFESTSFCFKMWIYKVSV